jgi:hypothetical protein
MNEHQGKVAWLGAIPFEPQIYQSKPPNHGDRPALIPWQLVYIDWLGPKGFWNYWSVYAMKCTELGNWTPWKQWDRFIQRSSNKVTSIAMAIFAY